MELPSNNRVRNTESDSPKSKVEFAPETSSSASHEALLTSTWNLTETLNSHVVYNKMFKIFLGCSKTGYLAMSVLFSGIFPYW